MITDYHNRRSGKGLIDAASVPKIDHLKNDLVDVASECILCGGDLMIKIVEQINDKEG
nr:12295_t:CDS:2 [Entrophospora candida]